MEQEAGDGNSKRTDEVARKENACPVAFVNRGDIKNQKFYLCTAINYMNGKPHIGHAYEIVVADYISRFHRVAGRETRFMTGSDEHGQKIANTAAAQGLAPIELCDKMVEAFQSMNSLLLVSCDRFIRTTEKHHEEVCHWMWDTALKNDDIYLGTYRGWYNVKEETFVTKANAEADQFKDPSSGIPYVMYDEETYFFRLSKYHDFILDLCKNTEYIIPQIRRSEIVARLESSSLEDLCISRSTFDWGVSVPNVQKHVMYVWFDALTNYVTGVDAHIPSNPLAKYWPCDCQLVGKDIHWFHAVIWPAMLKSCGLQVPVHVGSHGFVQATDGAKMSKSVGNVVDPVTIATEYGAEAFRYYLIRESRFGYDMRFSVDAMVDMHNADLADVLGNLVHRAVALCVKNCDSRIPDVSVSSETPPFDFVELFDRCEVAIGRGFDIRETAEASIEAVKKINQYLTAQAPWAIKDDPQRKSRVIRVVLESLYVAIHFLYPLLPKSVEEICKRLGTPLSRLVDLSPGLDNLAVGTPIVSGDILFKKFEKDDTGAVEKNPVAADTSAGKKKGKGVTR